MGALQDLVQRNTVVRRTGREVAETLRGVSEEFARIEPATPVAETFQAEPLRRVGQGLLSLVRGVLQGTARSGAAIGLGLTAPAGEVETFQLQPPEGTLLRRIKDTLFGEEPVRTIGGEIVQTRELLERIGVKEDVAGPAAFVVAPALIAIDFTTGGGKSKVLKSLAASDDVARISKLLRRVKVPAGRIDDVAQEVSKITNTKQIDELLTGIKISDKVAAKGVDDIITTLKKAEKEAVKTGKPVRKIVEQTFRLDKLNLTDEILEQITKRLKAVGLEKRTVRTFEEMQQAASDLGHAGVSDLLKNVKKTQITDKEVIALREEINFLGKSIGSKADDVKLAKTTDAQQFAQRELNALQTRLDKTLTKLIKGGTEVGRAVAAFRIQARNTLDVDYWLTQAKKQLKGEDLTIEMTQAINDLIARKDINGLANFVSMLRKSDLSEKAITLWKAGLLTSPTTHLANIGGNVTMQVLLTLSDVPSTGFDILLGLVTGKRTVTIAPATIAAKFKGIKAGAQDAREFLRTGIYTEDLLKKWDLPRNVSYGTSTGGKVLNGYTQSIFRSLGAEDLIFRRAAMSEAMEKQARIITKNEGLKGVAKKSRIQELLVRPTNEMQVNAIDAAEFATFQGENILANMVGGLKKIAATEAEKGSLSAKIALGVAEFLAPFVRTPTNIAARIADFSPLGFIKGIGRVIIDTKKAGGFKKGLIASQEKLVQDLGRAATGTGIITFGAWLGKEGLMTGNVPTNDAERADFFADGKQPNSIRIGDRWFQLNRVSPFGNLMALGAEFNRLGEEFEGTKRFAQTGFAGVKGLTEQTFLKGVSGGLKVLTDPERSLAKFGEQAIASTVPSIVGRIARTIDPRLRVPEGILETVQSRIPILSKGVPVRRDVFGQPIVTEGGRGRFAIVDPFNIQKAKDSPILREAARVGYTVGLPSQTILGTKLTNVEYSLYQKAQGKILKGVLVQAMNNEKYKGLSVGDQKEFLETVERDVRTQVRDAMFPALMIQRYDLPENTQPELLQDLISELNSIKKFKLASEEKKGRVIRNLLLAK